MKSKQTPLKDLWGCLVSLKTTTAHRRYPFQPESLKIMDQQEPFHIDAEVGIAPSRATKRLAGKTQVLTHPTNRHVKNRLTHTAEVTSVATTMARFLGLNVELVRAIALAHDIGHPPFGHAGEEFLNRQRETLTFDHDTFGVIVAQDIEDLNLTHEVLSSMLRGKHGANLPPEAEVVIWADRFAYYTGDFDDLLRIGFPVEDNLQKLMCELGQNQQERVETLITALIRESADKGKVSFKTGPITDTARQIRQKLYAIYRQVNYRPEDVLEKVFGFLEKTFPDIDPVVIMALMTDDDVIRLASSPVLDFSCLNGISALELVPELRERTIEWWKPDLNW